MTREIPPVPDDDVLGCGRTLSKLVSSRCQAAVLYLTDGGKDDPSRKYTDGQLADLRERSE